MFHLKATKRTDSEDNTASTVTTDTWRDDSVISGSALYGDDYHHIQQQHHFCKTKHTREPITRRGGVLFQESSEYELHPVRYSNAKKGCMKVASLEDSLRSCKLHKEQELKNKRRTSLNLESLTSSLRNLIQPAPRGCVSCSHSLDNTEHADETDITMESSDSTLTYFGRETKVRFAEISIRRYPVAPDDNPSATGKSAAIALSGWQYETTEPVSVDEYESSRQGRPPKKMEDLKINWIERRRRLLEAGASAAEISAFARRIQKAKAQRQETAQELSLYGKKHIVRLERQENMRHFIKRAIGLRKTNSKNQAALWDQAQKDTIIITA